MKLSKGHRTAATIISFLFFLMALAGFVHMINGKFPMIHYLPTDTKTMKDGMKVAGNAGANAGKYIGTYLRFYIFPFLFGYTGWLLYKIGREKPEVAAPDEKESPKISE